MITFDTEVKVLERESKSVPRRDGNGTFDFTEVKLETIDKKPTCIVARLATEDMEIKVGQTCKARVGITSTLTSTGRVFYNFVILAFQVTGQAKEEPVAPFEMDIDDELPF